MVKLSLFHSESPPFSARWWEGSEKGPWPASLANEVSVGMTWQLRGSLENQEELLPGRREPRCHPSWASCQLCGRG